MKSVFILLVNENNSWYKQTERARVLDYKNAWKTVSDNSNENEKKLKNDRIQFF